ncbi:hypothetical protein [Janthinobacterium tructae]|uniref:hypothetical protein n=1 Tax=Janthinobacterium tructae TaxID=2590869 RepID=UPI00249CF29C|nr:hypothetical protein [Janthinobacterium tructae]MDI3295419.1 hypothetical protein [Janthinobacterium tructae]
MQTLIVLFNLKDDVDAAAYERWARETDLPVASALASVDSFEVLRTLAVMGSDQAPPYQYIERLCINDMALLGQEAGSLAMQKVAAEFRTFADNPLFIITESI